MAAGKKKRIITISIDYPKAGEISPQMESLLRSQAIQTELLSTLMPARFAMKQTPMQRLYRVVTISHV